MSPLVVFRVRTEGGIREAEDPLAEETMLATKGTVGIVVQQLLEVADRVSVVKMEGELHLDNGPG
jgi:hypothetical protein